MPASRVGAFMRVCLDLCSALALRTCHVLHACACIAPVSIGAILDGPCSSHRVREDAIVMFMLIGVHGLWMMWLSVWGSCLHLGSLLVDPVILQCVCLTAMCADRELAGCVCVCVHDQLDSTWFVHATTLCCVACGWLAGYILATFIKMSCLSLVWTLVRFAVPPDSAFHGRGTRWLHCAPRHYCPAQIMQCVPFFAPAILC